MTSLLERAIAAVRLWFGMNDPSENHLHASHGWLLPEVAVARARTQVAAPVNGSNGWPKL